MILWVSKVLYGPLDLDWVSGIGLQLAWSPGAHCYVQRVLRWVDGVWLEADCWVSPSWSGCSWRQVQEVGFGKVGQRLTW